jgi:4-diphosphocytidyl-2-C-methyl-D-erythritol kinase
VSAGWRALAPGKVNLALFVGAPRPTDRLHPLVSVVQPVSLADELRLRPAPADAREDEVLCPGVEGPNLAGAALAAFRARTGWDAPPQRLEIVKRVPVAAGMGGGSGDAAAALRLAAAASGTDDPALLHELAVGLGADVPSQVSPGRVLMSGAGEHVEPLADPAPFGLVIVPLDAGLSTPEVYRAFDADAEPRTEEELDALTDELRTTWLAPERIHNDLEDAARGLCGLIDPALDAVRATGAPHVLVSGSGPTVFGILPTAEEAVAAARALAPAYPRTVAAEPTGPAFAAPQPLP